MVSRERNTKRHASSSQFEALFFHLFSIYMPFDCDFFCKLEAGFPCFFAIFSCRFFYQFSNFEPVLGTCLSFSPQLFELVHYFLHFFCGPSFFHFFNYFAHFFKTVLQF